MDTSTNNISSAFSLERFTTLAKADLLINKGYYIKLAIAAIGVFAAIAFLISINAGMEVHNITDSKESLDHATSVAISRASYGSMYVFISLWVISISLTLLGSLTFSNFSSKRSRIATLMVPASRVEKFTLRWLIYFVGGCILLIIGFLLGAAICQVAFGAWTAIFNLIKKFFTTEYAGFLIAYVTLVVLLGNSFYTLGSTIWPKLSWVKTWAVLAVAQWVISTLLMVVFAYDFNWWEIGRFIENNIDSLKWIGIVLLALLNTVCWILAWWRYKNTQIIQRFMTK